jgi:hypothetical protein
MSAESKGQGSRGRRAGASRNGKAKRSGGAFCGLHDAYSSSKLRLGIAQESKKIATENDACGVAAHRRTEDDCLWIPPD